MTCSLALYVEAQAVEAAPLEQPLKALIDQFSQPASQEFAQRLQQAARNVARQTTVAKTKAVELQTGQLLAAIADYVEVAAAEAALAQPLENLLQRLNQRQAPSKNKGQKNNPYLKAIADYIEQEAVEEVLPALENLVAELNTLRSSESIAPVAASPNSDSSKLALNSIPNHIEQATIESEITESMEGLAKELAPPQPKVSNLTKPLDTVISHLLQQLKAVGARKQQQTIASSVEAIVNYVEQSEVESALNPQVLQNLSKQLSGLSDRKLNAAIRQLEAFVTGYQNHLQAQAAKPIVKAIADYCEQTLIDEAIALDIERLTQNLSLPSKSKLPKQLQQLSSTIEQLRKLMEAQQNVTIQKPIDEPDVEQEPLANQKAQALEQQRLIYRQKYQELQKRVRSYPGFSDSPNWEVDIGVALLVGKESHDHNEVGCVLAQSDQLKEWKALLPEDEYMVKGKAYIHQVYDQAQQLREARSLQQQQKQDLDMEL